MEVLCFLRVKVEYWYSYFLGFYFVFNFYVLLFEYYLIYGRIREKMIVFFFVFFDCSKFDDDLWLN